MPNFLLDELLPALSSSELKLLFVVIRQTLGRKQGSGQRKSSDWMTGSQLRQRTGLSHTSISAAIESLIRKALIEVHDETGMVLNTPAQRRRCLRLYFRMGPQCQAFSQSSSQATIPQAPFQKAETTKESENKIISSLVDAKSLDSNNLDAKHPYENQSGQTFPDSGEATAEQEFSKMDYAPKALAAPGDAVRELSPGSQEVLRSYRQQFRATFPCQSPPLMSPADLELLEIYSKRHAPETLIRALPRFFQLDYGFNARCKYSLNAFLHSINVLIFGMPRLTQATTHAE